MFNWIDRKYVNPRQRKMKDMETGKIYTFEIQDDLDNIAEESETPLKAECLNAAQQVLKNEVLTETDNKIANLETLPSGGTTGQVLSKKSEQNGDAEWCDIEANEIYIGKAEDAPASAKLIIEDEDVEEDEVGEFIVSPTEPTGFNRVKKWIRHSKNKFDTSKRIYTSIAPNTVNSSFSNGVLTATGHTVYAFEVEVGKTYTLSWKNATGFNSMQAQNSQAQIFRTHETTSSNTFTATEKYLQINVLSNGEQLRIEDIQLELGSTATAYEPYVEDAEFVLENGKYVEFKPKKGETYSTEETRVGTWINGKPLYRKTIYSTSKTVTINVNYAMLIFKNFNTAINEFVFLSSRYSPVNGDAIQYYFNRNTKTFKCEPGDAWLTFHYMMFDIEYTKTTD